VLGFARGSSSGPWLGLITPIVGPRATGDISALSGATRIGVPTYRLEGVSVGD